jgi:hypothetical protein
MPLLTELIVCFGLFYRDCAPLEHCLGERLKALRRMKQLAVGSG